MIRVTEIRKTCSACPAQWEGTLDDGRIIYIRLRWGYLYAGVGKTLDEAIGGEIVFEWNSPNAFDGFMDYGQLKEISAGVIDLPDTDNEPPETREEYVKNSLQTINSFMKREEESVQASPSPSSND
jgi:hypothetical protein